MAEFSLDMATAEAEGQLNMNPRGYGFVKLASGFPDVFIPPSYTGGALHGDQVKIRYGEDHSGRPIGGVVALVVAAANPVFIARVDRSGSRCFLSPLDTRWPSRIALASPTDLPTGHLVQARLVVRPSGSVQAQAQIETSFGPRLTTAVAGALVMAQHELPQDFPASVQAEALALPNSPTPQDYIGRLDLRALPLVTIDGPTSRDFDDAVYAEVHPKGYRLLVAIADVAHYVPIGGALDEEAARRTTSVYLPDQVVPMLPEAVSNGLCSLNPHVDRLCMVAEMIITPTGQVASSKFSNAVMRSSARLTYDEVAAYLSGQSLPHLSSSVCTLLTVLEDVYAALSIGRAARGALDFETSECCFHEENETFVAAVEKPRTVAHRVIEECMIVANVAVAQALFESHRPAPYRVHTLHSPERHAEFQAWARGEGWALPPFHETSASDIKTLLAHSEHHPMKSSLVAQVRRLQGSASYTTQNAGHFGLALSAYTHFTSPIRRYPDLLVHRVLKELIAGVVPSYDLPTLDALAQACVTGERHAVAAERAVVDYQRACFMSAQVGEVFTATVSGHAPMGVFVTFGPQASSLLGPRELEVATYDGASRTWRQADGAAYLPPGTSVLVRLAKVDVDRARLSIERAPITLAD